MSYELFIAGRYLRTRRKQAFISLITILSIAGVALGVMALIIVISVMAGFENDLKARILSVEPDLIIEKKQGGLSHPLKVISRLKQIKSVKAASPFIEAQVVIRSRTRASGAALKGIAPDTAARIINILDTAALKPEPSSDITGIRPSHSRNIILGKELAANLGVVKNDPVYLISPRGMLSPTGHIPTMKKFNVAGFFEAGMYEYDGFWAFISLDDAQKLLKMKNTVSGIYLRVDDILKARNIKDAITDKIDPSFNVRDWMEMNVNLFSALKLEKTAMFIILALIVLVAALNIAGSLVMMVMEKKKEIAILKAMGATKKSISKIFIFKGLVIGAVGTCAGTVSGLGICLALKKFDFINLPEEVYYITSLPVQTNTLDIVYISFAAMAICLAAALYPARHASQASPVEAIRHG